LQSEINAATSCVCVILTVGRNGLHLTNDDDCLVAIGTATVEFIFGMDGNDVLCGGEGNDGNFFGASSCE
jgi:hypothetical protein